MKTFFHSLLVCVLVSLFSTKSLHCGKTVLIVPCERNEVLIANTEAYHYFLPDRPVNNWWWLDKMLREKDMQMIPYDFSKNPAVNTQVIICKNYPTWISDWERKIQRIKHKKVFLIMYEPPSVLPEMYSRRVFSLFDKVFTWDDDLVDGKKFLKFYYAVLLPMIDPVPDFSTKKLLTMVVANKTSSHPNELYSERKGVIEFFERDHSDDFEFYGKGWGNGKYKNYRGAISCVDSDSGLNKEKIAVIKNYRFCICYENVKNIKGYVTEKIFDSFAAGCVPIYWGASNIKEYIPENCYILRENFGSMEELYFFIKNMKEEEYNEYLKNIRKYLKSAKAEKFSFKSFAQNLFQQINAE